MYLTPKPVYFSLLHYFSLKKNVTLYGDVLLANVFEEGDLGVNVNYF